MFRNSSNDIEEFTTFPTVTGFINKCIEDAIPTGTVRTYPNQKPWIIGNIRTELKGRAAAFKVWDSEAYKKSHYALRRTIKQATRQYRAKCNHTTPAPTLVGCGRARKLLQATKGSTATSCPVTRAYQMS